MLNYVPLAEKPPKRTQSWSVLHKTGGTLGIIKWYAPWRRYVFYPHEDTLFDANCLINLTDFLIIETNKRKQNWGIHGS